MNQKLQTVIPSYYIPKKKKKKEQALRNTNKDINRVFPEDHKSQIVYTETKLGSKFNYKYLTKKEQVRP